MPKVRRRFILFFGRMEHPVQSLRKLYFDQVIIKGRHSLSTYVGKVTSKTGHKWYENVVGFSSSNWSCLATAAGYTADPPLTKRSWGGEAAHISFPLTPFILRTVFV